MFKVQKSNLHGKVVITPANITIPYMVLSNNRGGMITIDREQIPGLIQTLQQIYKDTENESQ